MKFKLHHLLSAEVSNETAFQLVQFTRGLALALESIYFDQMLMNTSTDNTCQHFNTEKNEDEAPF